MKRKTKLPGWPDEMTDRYLAALEDGCMSPGDQREFYKVLVHKLSGKPGVAPLWIKKSHDRFLAWARDGLVQNEIRRLEAAGPPSAGGYRAEALEIVADRLGLKSGEALDVWLRRNRKPTPIKGGRCP